MSHFLKAGRAMRIVVAVVIGILAVGGGSWRIAVALAPSPDPSARAFTSAQKLEIEAELEAVLLARRALRWTELWAHGRRALDLAERFGQDRLAASIRSSMGTGCFASVTEFHVRMALRILRGLPARDGAALTA